MLRVLLISTYELGRQPFGLASPAAWLERAGAEVRCRDLAVQEFASGDAAWADLIALYLPMHTATRLAAALIPALRRANPDAHVCGFGLYAAMNEPYLRRLGVDTLLGGEFEAGLAALYRRLEAGRDGPNDSQPITSMARLRFLVPARDRLPPLQSYAHLHLPGGDQRLVGYTEASRGCKHRCTHCPIVPVYQGRFRVVPPDVVLADVRQQIAAGAQHITFGDPDFLNGPGHATRLVKALHAEFPEISYDITAKVEHLLRHRDLLPLLRDTGCALVTSAFEAFDDHVLDILGKGHTVADMLELRDLCQRVGLALNPTFVAFTPWTTPAGYRRFLDTLADLGLIGQVAPIQLAIRLLLPAGSELLSRPDVQAIVGPFDEAGLAHPWTHPDPAVDKLQEEVMAIVRRGTQERWSRAEAFTRVYRTALGADDATSLSARSLAQVAVSDPIPFLSEPWYC